MAAEEWGPAEQYFEMESCLVLLVKGALVGLCSAALPRILFYLLVFSDGVSPRETDGFNYAGLSLLAVAYVVIFPMVVLPLWAAFKGSVPYLTAFVVVPVAVLAWMLVAIVLNGDCLDPDSVC